MKQVLNAVPNVRLTAKGLRRRQNMVIGAVLCAALMGPIALFTAARNSGAVVVEAPAASSKTIAFATSVAEDFLAGSGTVMPAAAGVDRMFGRNVNDTVAFSYSSLTYYSDSVTVVGGSRVDTVNFTVESTSGQFFRLAIPVTFSDAGRQLLAASPAMLPATFATTASASSPTPETATSDIPANVEERVALWADAYARDDSQALRVIVNDSDAPTGGSYLGLGGFTCQNGCTEVLWASASPTDGSLVVARVRALFTSQSANEFVMSNEFDVLIRGWDSDAPRILAWAPAGSGDLLTPYINNTAR